MPSRRWRLGPCLDRVALPCVQRAFVFRAAACGRETSRERGVAALHASSLSADDGWVCDSYAALDCRQRVEAFARGRTAAGVCLSLPLLHTRSFSVLFRHALRAGGKPRVRARRASAERSCRTPGEFGTFTSGACAPAQRNLALWLCATLTRVKGLVSSRGAHDGDRDINACDWRWCVRCRKVWLRRHCPRIYRHGAGICGRTVAGPHGRGDAGSAWCRGMIVSTFVFVLGHVPCRGADRCGRNPLVGNRAVPPDAGAGRIAAWRTDTGGGTAWSRRWSWCRSKGSPDGGHSSHFFCWSHAHSAEPVVSTCRCRHVARMRRDGM